MLKRRGFTLIELLVVVVIIGILASVALPSFVGAQDKARNSAVQGNLNTVKLALETYATDNNGQYPNPGAGFVTAYAGGGGAKGGKGPGETGTGLGGLEFYLPSGILPKSPWAKEGQGTFALVDTSKGGPPAHASSASAGEVKIKNADNIQAGESPSAIGQKIGTGQVPQVGTTMTMEHYGAISYHYHRGSAVYVVYGTGKKGKDAIVAGASSNAGQ